jgi:hypothetical protein
MVLQFQEFSTNTIDHPPPKSQLLAPLTIRRVILASARETRVLYGTPRGGRLPGIHTVP